MSERLPFLFELGVEEIPHWMITPALAELEKLFAAFLEENRLGCGTVGLDATPRRLVLSVEGLTAESRPVREERKGPAVTAPAAAVEGFLRSTRSLIQTFGRASRNVSGKVILYADHMTESMREAISETERRREKQRKYNERHGITRLSTGDMLRAASGANAKEMAAASAVPQALIATVSKRGRIQSRHLVKSGGSDSDTSDAMVGAASRNRSRSKTPV